MIGRLVAGLLRLAALALAASVAAAPAPPPRIVAVGDLHGDFAAWRAIARDAGLIDAAGAWTGGRTVFVQLGDAVDRGPDSLGVVRDLMRLQREAARAGGRVVALVGNHEAMNVTDDLRYVAPADFAAFADSDSAARRDRVFKLNRADIEAADRQRDPGLNDAAIRQAWYAATPLGLIEHQSAWHPTGEIGRWVTGNPAVALIDGTLFVHGGLTPRYAQMPLDKINRRVAAALTAGETSRSSILYDPDGPLWYRGLAAAPERQIDALLAATGAARIVIAHTPVLTGILSQYGGKLVRIDTGISAVFGGTPSWLEIVNGVAVPHVVARPAPIERKP